MKFLCNDMHLNHNDSTIGVYVTGYYEGVPEGINIFQGIPIQNTNSWEWLASGNLFSNKTGFKDYNFAKIYKNSLAEMFVYSYSTANSSENPVYANVPLSIVSQNTCPTKTLPYITYPQFITKIKSIEKNINTMQEMVTFSSSDSLAFIGLLQEHHNLIDSMLSTYMYGDSVAIRYDSMSLALEQVDYGYFNKVKLAGVYLKQLRYHDAQELLNGLEEMYNLNETQSKDINNMAIMYSVIDSLEQNGDRWDSLPIYLKEKVNIVANEEGIYGSAVAHYLQERYENIFFHSPSPHLEDNFNMVSGKFKNKKTEENRIFPSPALNYLHLHLGNSKANNLIIYDIKGMVYKEFKVHKGFNSFNISDLPTGIYIAKIFENNKPIFQQKIIKK